jgi:hypothetical protein
VQLSRPAYPTIPSNSQISRSNGGEYTGASPANPGSCSNTDTLTQTEDLPSSSLARRSTDGTNNKVRNGRGNGGLDAPEKDARSPPVEVVTDLHDTQFVSTSVDITLEEVGFTVEEVQLRPTQAVRPCNAIIPLALITSDASRAALKNPNFPGLPVVIWLHATGGSAALMRPRLLAYAAMGFLAVAMDCRYHGKRCEDCEGCTTSWEEYQHAVFRCIPIIRLLSDAILLANELAVRSTLPESCMPVRRCKKCTPAS